MTVEIAFRPSLRRDRVVVVHDRADDRGAEHEHQETDRGVDPGVHEEQHTGRLGPPRHRTGRAPGFPAVGGVSVGRGRGSGVRGSLVVRRSVTVRGSLAVRRSVTVRGRRRGVRGRGVRRRGVGRCRGRRAPRGTLGGPLPGYVSGRPLPGYARRSLPGSPLGLRPRPRARLLPRPRALCPSRFPVLPVRGCRGRVVARGHGGLRPVRAARPPGAVARLDGGRGRRRRHRAARVRPSPVRRTAPWRPMLATEAPAVQPVRAPHPDPSASGTRAPGRHAGSTRLGGTSRPKAGGAARPPSGRRRKLSDSP
ncbi:hypothetical protein GA0115252_109418 [Streptomyces sp. DfronAA-171]|nr:hypothetical protein GA0115252_109418 [Streptomyces sp. DfronAA-171]